MADATLFEVLGLNVGGGELEKNRKFRIYGRFDGKEGSKKRVLTF